MTPRSIGDDPFATPVGSRAPARRLRGASVAPVTIWTSGDLGSPVGLTVSSVLVAEGRPSLVLGLLNDTSDLWEALVRNGMFVMHLIPAGHHATADIFAGLRPSPGGPFVGLDLSATSYGPVIERFADRAYCRVLRTDDRGFQKLVTAELEKIDLGDLLDPLIHFRGRYRQLAAED